VLKVIWQKAASPSCLSLTRRGGEYIRPLRVLGTYVGTLECAGTCPPKKCPFPWDLDPHVHMTLCTHLSQPSKRHLDRFSRFLHSSPVCQTHRQTAYKRQTHRSRYVLHLSSCVALRCRVVPEQEITSLHV